MWSLDSLPSPLSEPHFPQIQPWAEITASQAFTLLTCWAVRFTVMFLLFNAESFSAPNCERLKEIVSESITFKTHKFLFRLRVWRKKESETHSTLLHTQSEYVLTQCAVFYSAPPSSPLNFLSCYVLQIWLLLLRVPNISDLFSLNLTQMTLGYHCFSWKGKLV